jgi:hypothetical protein
MVEMMWVFDWVVILIGLFVCFRVKDEYVED